MKNYDSNKGTENDQVLKCPKLIWDQLIKLFTAIEVGKFSNPKIQNFVSPKHITKTTKSF